MYFMLYRYPAQVQSQRSLERYVRPGIRYHTSVQYVIICHSNVQYTALYDYNPMKHSPNDNPEFELAFKQGDIISVHGREKDGYLVGEVGSS